MFKINAPENNENYALFERFLAKSFSFAATGLTTILRLLLVTKIRKITDKKVLFVTSTEQNALRYQNDLLKAFGEKSDLLPFQNISMYEMVSPNRYDYAEQYRILNEKPDIVIAPVKTILEKFPDENFYKNNSTILKVGDEVDTKILAQKFVDFGYKHSTMVSDIGEFSIRGDIVDFYSLDKHPVRIELWGDEIVDIRYFNNETQKSIEKLKSTEILPMYKFTLSDVSDDLWQKLAPKDEGEEKGYFEGIEIYQNYFNDKLVTVLDYFKDYILVLDETSELYAKYEFLDKGYEEQLQENLKLELNEILKGRNHVTFEEFIQKTAGFVKVGLNNFIDSEMDEIVEFDTQTIQSFEANLDHIADFIRKFLFPQHSDGWRIVIATDYPERVKEILAERNIFDVEYNESISSHGAVLTDLKFLGVVLTLFSASSRFFSLE